MGVFTRLVSTRYRYAASYAVALLMLIAWILALTCPLVRTSLPYTLTLLPDYRTTYTTYSLLHAHADYAAFKYEESGDVLRVEWYNDHTLNSTFGYNHQQTFGGITCSYHVHTNVTGYDSDGTPQGDVYPELDAPGCSMLVAFRSLLVTFFFLFWLPFFLSWPSHDVDKAVSHHRQYGERLVRIEDAYARYGGQPAALHEDPPSTSRCSVTLPAYDGPGCPVDMDDMPPPPADPPLPPPPPYQPPPPPPPRALRLHLPAAQADTAQQHLRAEGDALHSGIQGAVVALVAVLLGLTLSLGSIVFVVRFVNDSGWGEQREVLWPVWLYTVTMPIYVLLVLAESVCVYYSLVAGVRDYLQHEDANWRVLFRGSPPYM